MSKNKILICGSYAFDNIMNFNDKFENHILSNKLHAINVCFLTPNMRKEFGGCAGNIAYNLNLLGANVAPMATVGEDFSQYTKHLKNCQITTKYIKTIKNNYSAQAFIVTDNNNNQITIFHPGAMNESHKNKINIVKDVAIGILSPDGKNGMIAHGEQFAEAKIPFVFDPGQGLPMFNKQELMTFVKQADYVIVNDYEAQMLQEKTNLSITDITKKVHAMIVTNGALGSKIYTKKETINIAPIYVENPKDPTGCGDAYRAGLLYGLTNNLNWQTIGKLASLLGSIKVAHLGTQNHTFDMGTIKKLYLLNYKEGLTV